MGYQIRKNRNGLRVIKTARTLEAINTAIREGFNVIIKKVEPSPFIRSKYALVRNKHTGEIEQLSDFRAEFYQEKGEYELVMNWTSYYPHCFPSPFAAYIVPNDLEVGDRVYIEDLIEDLVYGTWNQGDVFRLQGSDAIWTGDDFHIQFDQNKDRVIMVG